MILLYLYVPKIISKADFIKKITMFYLMFRISFIKYKMAEIHPYY